MGACTENVTVTCRLKPTTFGYQKFVRLSHKNEKKFSDAFFAQDTVTLIDYDTTINSTSAPLMHNGICDTHWFPFDEPDPYRS